MVRRAALTDAKIAGLRPAPAGGRYHVYDADESVPGFGVRVTDKGPVSFILYTRFSPGAPPARSALGRVGEIKVEQARNKAEQWLSMLESGLDPRAEEREARAAARQAKAEARKARRDLSFRAVAEAYIQHKRSQKHRRVVTAEREIQRHLVSRWGPRPLGEITRLDVATMINELLAEGKRRSAHDAFGHARSIFNWAIEQSSYDLEVSPCDRLRPARLIGEREFRQRVLSDDELFALWRASGRLGYPVAPLYRLLLLTGGRLSEVAGARWREFNPELVRLIREGQERDEPIDWSRVPAEWRLWTIPPERFKSNATHLVPLSDEACRVLETVPHFRRGDHLFSVATSGAKPLGDFSNLKSRLDRRMLRTLRALARTRGADPETVELARWVNHDIRRTVRTRLSALRVPHDIAELVIGHAKRGLARVYNQHPHLEEMREALESWSGLLRSVTGPRADNVVPLLVREERK